MRFLLDAASADFRLITYLVERGHDVATVASDYPQTLKDPEVVGIALQERRILITNDRDFGELIFRQRLSHAGIIYFRLERTDLDTKIQGLERVLSDHGHQLSEFIVVTERGIRVRGSV